MKGVLHGDGLCGKRRVTHIATTSRIRVSQPCPSNILALLDEFKIVDSEFADDLDGKTEAAHACADDEDFCIERHCVYVALQALVNDDLFQREAFQPSSPVFAVEYLYHDVLLATECPGHPTHRLQVGRVTLDSHDTCSRPSMPTFAGLWIIGLVPSGEGVPKADASSTNHAATKAAPPP